MSDTHDNIRLARAAARALVEAGAELVVHLGDIVAPFTLRAIAGAGVRRLVAVYGNNCGEKLGLLRAAQGLGFEIHDPPYALVVDGRRLLLMHGQGPPEETRAVAESIALSGRFDAVLYGHTHQPDVRRLGGTLLLNPGEACGCLTGRATVALLDTRTMEARVLTVAELGADERL